MTKYGYIRVSTVKQANEGSSIESQREALRTFGVKDQHMIVDDGVTGSMAWDQRPQGGILLQAAKRGDTIVVTKLDRAFRSVEDCSRCLDMLERRGVDIVILNLGHEPVSKGSMASMTLKLLALLAEFERTMIAERTMEGKRMRSAQGFFLGGKPPYGFEITAENQLVEHEWRARAIAHMRDMRKNGTTYRAIRDHMAAHFAPAAVPGLNTIKRLTDSVQDVSDLI